MFLGGLSDPPSTRGPHCRLHSDLRRRTAASGCPVYTVFSSVSPAARPPPSSRCGPFGPRLAQPFLRVCCASCDFGPSATDVLFASMSFSVSSLVRTYTRLFGKETFCHSLKEKVAPIASPAEVGPGGARGLHYPFCESQVVTVLGLHPVEPLGSCFHHHQARSASNNA